MLALTPWDNISLTLTKSKSATAAHSFCSACDHEKKPSRNQCKATIELRRKPFKQDWLEKSERAKRTFASRDRAAGSAGFFCAFGGIIASLQCDFRFSNLRKTGEERRHHNASNFAACLQRSFEESCTESPAQEPRINPCIRSALLLHITLTEVLVSLSRNIVLYA